MTNESACAPPQTTPLLANHAKRNGGATGANSAHAECASIGTMEDGEATNTSSSRRYGSDGQVGRGGAEEEDPLTPRNAADGMGSANGEQQQRRGIAPHHATLRHPLVIGAILSTSFAYGCIMTTLFLITLPLEMIRIEADHGITKSIALALFVAMAGVTQLICPIVGMLSDRFQPPRPRKLGDDERPSERLPYLIFGTILVVVGLLGQIICSSHALWGFYSASFFLCMIGINVVYSIMIALIPDLVPESQTGVANGMLALLMVSGSLSGFFMFHRILDGSVACMYYLYVVTIVVTATLTLTFAKESTAPPSRASGKPNPLLATVGNTPFEEGAKIFESEYPSILTYLWMMLCEPIRDLTWSEVRSAYWVDPHTYHDFFVVTVSRFFYYMGISSQTFFLYFVHDVLHEHTDPEAAVALLAFVGQVAGAVTCYPVGLLSDTCAHGQRKPFVYLACALLMLANFSLLACTEMKQMLFICAFLGGANGMYLTMDTSLAVDTLPHHSSINGCTKEVNDRICDDRGSAQLLGIWGVAGFLGSALGPLTYGPLLCIFGSERNGDIVSTGEAAASDRDDYSFAGYAVILSLSACYFVCSALSLRYVKDKSDNATKQVHSVKLTKYGCGQLEQE